MSDNLSAADKQVVKDEKAAEKAYQAGSTPVVQAPVQTPAQQKAEVLSDFDSAMSALRKGVDVHQAAALKARDAAIAEAKVEAPVDDDARDKLFAEADRALAALKAAFNAAPLADSYPNRTIFMEALKTRPNRYQGVVLDDQSVASGPNPLRYVSKETSSEITRVKS